jgi:hypothetical protein
MQQIYTKDTLPYGLNKFCKVHRNRLIRDGAFPPPDAKIGLIELWTEEHVVEFIEGLARKATDGKEAA